MSESGVRGMRPAGAGASGKGGARGEVRGGSKEGPGGLTGRCAGLDGEVS